MKTEIKDITITSGQIDDLDESTSLQRRDAEHSMAKMTSFRISTEERDGEMIALNNRLQGILDKNAMATK